MMRNIWSVLLVAWTVTQIHSESTSTSQPAITHWDVLEGTSAILLCPLWHHEDQIATSSSIFWFLPNGTEVLSKSEKDEDIRIDPHGTLILKRPTPEHSGEYVCIIKRQADAHELAVVTLSVTAVPVPLTAWEENEPRVVRGGIAAGILVFIFSSLCLIYKFRWKKPKESLETSESSKKVIVPVDQMDSKIPSDDASLQDELPASPTGLADVKGKRLADPELAKNSSTIQVDDVCPPATSNKEQEHLSTDENADSTAMQPKAREIQVQYAAESQVSIDHELEDGCSKEDPVNDSSRELANIHQQGSNKPEIQVHYTSETDVTNALELEENAATAPLRDHDVPTSAKGQKKITDTSF